MFLTLFSNARNLAPHSRVGDFETNLNRQISLDGEYEMALVSAHIPLNINILTVDTSFIMIDHAKSANVTRTPKDEGELKNFIIAEAAKRGLAVTFEGDVIRVAKLIDNDLNSYTFTLRFSRTKREYSFTVVSDSVTQSIPALLKQRELVVVEVKNNTRQKVTVVLPKNEDVTIQKIVNIINEKLGSKTAFVFDETQGKVKYTGISARLDEIELSEQLTAVLGFDSPVFNRAKSEPITATRFPDLKAGYKFFIINTPVVEPQLIGNNEVPMLSVAPMLDKNGTEYRIFEPVNLLYKRIIQKNFSSIRLTITNETGSVIDYPATSTSPVSVTLHIRRAL